MGLGLDATLPDGLLNCTSSDTHSDHMDSHGYMDVTAS